MDPNESARDAILSALPRLRGYAVSLTGSRERGDDLVQEALLRALTKLSSLHADTNTLAWLINILRNQFVPEHRKLRPEVEHAELRHSSRSICHPAQDSWMADQNFRKALARLPLDQREAIILVEGSRFSYEQAAGICGCPAGMIKSRVNEARRALARALSNEDTTSPGRLERGVTRRISMAVGTIPDGTAASQH